MQVLPNNAYEPGGDSDGNTGVETGSSFGAETSSPSGSGAPRMQYPAMGDPPIARSPSPQPASQSEPQSAHGSVDQSSTEAGRSRTTEQQQHQQQQQQPRPGNAAPMAVGSDAHDASATSRGATGSHANGSRAATGCDRVSGGGDAANPSISEDKKRVRFAVYQPVQRRGSVEPGAQALMQVRVFRCSLVNLGGIPCTLAGSLTIHENCLQPCDCCIGRPCHTRWV